MTMTIAFYIYRIEFNGNIKKIQHQPEEGFTDKNEAIKHLKELLITYSKIEEELKMYGTEYLILDTYSK